VLRAWLSFSAQLVGLIKSTFLPTKLSSVPLKYVFVGMGKVEIVSDVLLGKEKRTQRLKKNYGSFWKSSNHSFNAKVYSPFQRMHCGHIDHREIKANLLQNSSLKQKNKLTVFFFLNYEVTGEEIQEEREGFKKAYCRLMESSQPLLPLSIICKSIMEAFIRILCE